VYQFHQSKNKNKIKNKSKSNSKSESKSKSKSPEQSRYSRVGIEELDGILTMKKGISYPRWNGRSQGQLIGCRCLRFRIYCVWLRC
jgi:hypothetical protein